MTEYIRERFEVQRKDNNVMNGKFAGPPRMKDEIRAATRTKETGKPTGRVE